MGRSFRRCIRIVAPGMVISGIWRSYTATVFGNESWTQRSIIENIRSQIYSWCMSMKGTKYSSYDSQPVALGLSPPLSA